MIRPQSMEELASYVDHKGKTVFIKPFLPEIEAENPDFTFVEVDRDQYMAVAQKWDVYGIPSLVVVEDGREIGRYVNRDRKTKSQINDFLASL